MAVLFDNTFLCHLITGGTKLPAEDKDKLDYLMETLSETNESIIIPTPVLAETLIPSGDALIETLGYLTSSKHFKIVPFDQRAAIEVAIAHNKAIKAGDKKESTGANWSKVKYDRQIVAIGRVESVTTIYSDDKDVISYATRDGIKVISRANLPSRPVSPQHEMNLIIPVSVAADAATLESMKNDVPLPESKIIIASVSKAEEIQIKSGSPAKSPNTNNDSPQENISK